MEPQYWIPLASAAAAWIATIATIKTDIGWIKHIISDHGERLSAVEKARN